MDPEETYAWLIGPPGRRPVDRFDAHVLASVFTLALMETDWGQAGSLTEALGLGFDETVATLASHVPHALVEIAPALRDAPIERAEDEAVLLNLLWRAGGQGELRSRLARILARRAQRPNRLWQDLGLRNRGELATLMHRHFARLARRNTHDIRWKRFFYQSICRDPAYALCNRPSCVDCAEFLSCFGEDGAHRLPALGAAA
jgi:nitrogen fixation protein NifQ